MGHRHGALYSTEQDPNHYRVITGKQHVSVHVGMYMYMCVTLSRSIGVCVESVCVCD